MNTNDPYAHDTAPDWDGTPSTPTASDIFSPEEASACLELYAAKAAKSGRYGEHSDLRFIAELIRELDR